MKQVGIANLITLSRVALAFGNLASYTFVSRLWAFNGNLALTALVILLDGLDGYVARRLHTETNLGAELDIAADRIVENLYWVFFACSGLIPLWIPALVLARGCATDFVRSEAARHGMTAFGPASHIRSVLGRALVCSRVSRCAYGAIKALAFAALGVALAFSRGVRLPGIEVIAHCAPALAWLALAFCLVRAWPVLTEGFRLLCDAAWRHPEQSGRPLLSANARPRATNGSGSE